MPRNQFKIQGTITYCFLRSKEVRIENGLTFITLFVRLTREFTKSRAGKKTKIREVVWVEIEEVKLEHAPVKMKTLPSGVQEFNVSEKVFRELLQTALTSPKELYYVTTPLRTVSKNIEIS